MGGKLAVWAYCAALGAAAVIWLPGWWRLAALIPTLTVYATWALPHDGPPAVRSGPQRPEQGPAGPMASPPGASRAPGGAQAGGAGGGGLPPALPPADPFTAPGLLRMAAERGQLHDTTAQRAARQWWLEHPEQTKEWGLAPDGTQLLPALPPADAWQLAALNAAIGGQDWGEYPRPHCDEYDTCRCPDHVAMRRAVKDHWTEEGL